MSQNIWIIEEQEIEEIKISRLTQTCLNKMSIIKKTQGVKNEILFLKFCDNLNTIPRIKLKIDIS